MKTKIKSLMVIAATFAMVYGSGAYSCILGIYSFDCHVLHSSCTTYNAPGCEGVPVYGTISQVGVNMANYGFAGPGQTGHDGSSELKPCVAKCSSTFDCNGAQNVGTVSMNYNYWTMGGETCGPM
jgi:hypothetical protein